MAIQTPPPAQQGAFARFLATAPVMFALITMIASGLAGFGAAQIRLAQYDWNDQQSKTDRADIHQTLKEHEAIIQKLSETLVEIKTTVKSIDKIVSRLDDARWPAAR